MTRPTKTDSEREKQLVRAWDFLEHWHMRLSRDDGALRLEEFYSAMFKLLKTEGRYQP